MKKYVEVDKKDIITKYINNETRINDEDYRVVDFNNDEIYRISDVVFENLDGLKEEIEDDNIRLFYYKEV